jgi:hypothetical protein
MKIAYVNITSGFKGPLFQSPQNQLGRKLGRYETIVPGPKGGTVKDSDGKYWDWHLDDAGVVQVYKAV